MAGSGDDQRATIALLLDPATHGGASQGVTATRRIDTHGAVVVLAGERVFKLKRAVKFPFLDYSTVERRRAACAAELQINRRTAPDLYLAVRPIVADGDGRLTLGAPGTEPRLDAVDWVLEMRRFADDALFDQRARDGLLDTDTVLKLADAIAEFHAAAELRPEHGGLLAMRRIVDGVVDGLVASGLVDGDRLDRFAGAIRKALDGNAALLDRRRDQGFVRHGHGDLHLGNVCLWQGEPTLFDAIEFDDRIACGDVLYDLAFLLMDLQHRGLPGLANAAFNRYLMRAMADAGAAGGDALLPVDGLAALPLFLATRAAIRAQVGLAAARRQADAARAQAKIAEAGAYLDLALACLDPPRPRLLAVGGLSGTGKSTLALGLAPMIGPVPGALVLRSDALRKTLAGGGLFDRLPPAAYDRAMTARVFDGLAEGARRALAAGHAAIADAVYLAPAQRLKIEAVAKAAGAPFAGLWLEAPAGQLEARVSARRGDVSDAGADIVRMQLAQDPGPMAWHRIDAGGTPAEVLARSRAALGL
ncbi:MAG: AAA family ATPase [Rhodospirillales bacterium]|nr:AAA family ATPase [Rhodospirillales bacterium]